MRRADGEVLLLWTLPVLGIVWLSAFLRRNIVGVHFSNVTVMGNALTSQTDADATWSINAFVSGITFGP